MVVKYQPNQQDTTIIGEITAHLHQHLDDWYGAGSRLDTTRPEIRSYRNCFILYYPVTRASGKKKRILVKIRRNPKMDSLWRAIAADIHANIPTEYNSLQSVFNELADADEDFGVIRPLDYLEKYFAIVMEEYPSQTLRQMLVRQRNSKNPADRTQLLDAARKTGKWLHNFHHRVYAVSVVEYSSQDILDVVKDYGTHLERYTGGRVRAQSLVDAFAQKLNKVPIDSILMSQTHADMTCDNTLYSEDGKVCVIDIKTRLAPVYSDLGLILIHPETFKQQIFTHGAYLPESVLKEYRAAILEGYFGSEAYDEFLVQLFSAIKVIDKWSMYEELWSRYKGLKRFLTRPLGPLVTRYFQNVLQKHLDLLVPSIGQRPIRVSMEKSADSSV